jgi:ABC transporter DrrB family efflux protein
VGRYIDFLIPGLIALNLLTTSLFGTGMGIVTARRENLLKRYRVTPMHLADYILSHILGRYMIACLEIGTILVFGWVVFGYSLAGSWLDFGLMVLLGTGAFTALGIFAGSRTQNSSAYHGMVHLITMPMMILGGVWFSQSSFPPWLARWAAYSPLTALVEGLRGIALDGRSLSELGPQAMILSVFGILCALGAKKLWTW